MLLFRSEEHIRRWCARWDRSLGAILTLSQAWHLSEAWYREDRRRPEWRRRTPEEIRTLFREIGLTSDFWNL